MLLSYSPSSLPLSSAPTALRSQLSSGAVRFRRARSAYASRRCLVRISHPSAVKSTTSSRRTPPSPGR